MENMDNFRERFEALEQQTKAMQAHTHTVERRLRWWRGIACGVVILALLSLALPSGRAADAPGRGMADRMAALEDKLTAMTFDAASNEVVITGANLRIVNGLGSTDTTNELGNLIVGYNEPREGNPNCLPGLAPCTDIRTGSHNVVVGRQHNFSSFGGLVVGDLNTISGDFSSVSGSTLNTASGIYASVSGGSTNTASGRFASVSGGFRNTATNDISSISGGLLNRATANGSSVSGGQNNMASGLRASICGGNSNTASAFSSSVSGGFRNTASGGFSSVSGGLNRTAPGEHDWAAGPLFADF